MYTLATSFSSFTQAKSIEMVMNACLLLSIMVSFGVLTFQRAPGEDRYLQPGDITLGGLFTLHYTTDDGGCGDFSPVGLGHVEAMKFAIDKINRNPNLLPNKTLGYDIRDYCGSTAKAIEHTYDFVRRNDIDVKFQNASYLCTIKDNITQNTPTPVRAVIGPTDSQTAILVGSLLQVAGIPVISHSATSNELSSALYRDFFRTAPPDRQQTNAIADIIQYFNWSYVAAVAMDDSYGRNGVRGLESEAAERETFCLSFAEYIPRQEHNTKLTRVVSKLKSYSNIRVVVLWLLDGYGRQFLEEAAKQKMFHHTWIFSDGLTTGSEVLVSLKNKHKGIVHGSLGIQPQHLHNPHFDDFLMKESTKMDRAPWWREFWKPKSNLSLNVSLNKQKPGKETPLRAVYDTYIPYVVDAVSAVAHAIHNMNEIRPTGNPKRLVKYLGRVKFKGLTGKINFNDFGDPETSSYDIVHFQLSDKSDLIKLVIGSWDQSPKKKLQLNVTNMKWNTVTGKKLFQKSFCSEDCPAGTRRVLTTPCCWECLNCPDGTISAGVNDVNCTECRQGQRPDEGKSKCLNLPEIEVTWSSLTSVLVVLSASVGYVLVAICSFFLYKHRETPLVKAANRELSSILMLTITMSFSVSILSLAKPTNFVCSLVHFWRSMVLVIFISILIIKTMKILSAFEINVIAEKLQKFILATKRQTLIVLALIFPPVVFFSLWIALDSPHQRRIIQTNEGRIILSCSLYQSSIGLSLQVVISVYTSLLAVVCTFYAFKARSLPENFNEARYIGFSMYILLLSSVAYFPIDIGLKGSHATNLICAMTLVSSYGLLTCMFGPKIYVISFKPEQNTHQAVSSQVSKYSFNPFRKGKIAVAPVQLNATGNQKHLQLEFASTSNSRN